MIKKNLKEKFNLIFSTLWILYKPSLESCSKTLICFKELLVYALILSTAL